MWGESSKNCEMNCQCSGLITENFKINSGNSASKRKQDEAFSTNFKLKMNPHSLNFSPLSPKATPSKRRILGEITNTPLFKSPIYKSPVIERLKQSPVDRNTSPVTSKSTNKISRIFEERTRFKMENKENERTNIMSETFMKLDTEEETRDCQFGDSFDSNKTWSNTKLDFTDALHTKFSAEKDIFVPEKDETDLDSDFQTLHDLEEEFESDNFDHCTKYEIISTDSPDIISRGRSSTSRKVTSRNFVFGAPLADNEQSTSFNRPNVNATRMLNFEDEAFEFTSPAMKRPSTSNVSVKKSLKFTETPTKNPLRHERSDSSIGSMSSSPASSRLRIFTSESTTSMESGFISELEEPFLDIEEASNSPKVANFNDLLSGPIKDNILVENKFLKPNLQRSLSFNPESKARVSLFSILESPKRSVKRVESGEEGSGVSKRRKQNPEVERIQRPVLQRAFSENNASIMSALARSAVDPDLIGDFSLPFALPLTSGDHSDLKSISCDTLAALMNGDYSDCIEDFQGSKGLPVRSPGFKTRKKGKDKEQFGCICSECNKCFETKSKRWKHIQRYHREGYACDKCGKKFAFRNNLNRHVRLHQSPPPREQCQVCHKLVRCDLIKIHARIHATRECHTCRECNKTFVSRASYEHHLKYTRAHSQADILKYKCSECDKGYRSRGELRDHANYQHMGRTQHKCPECGKALATRRCITRHVRRAHRGVKENARDKICQQCGKAFRDKKGLREHEFIHTGERPLSCEICGCTFRQSASLYTHRKRVHKIYPQKKNVEIVDTSV